MRKVAFISVFIGVLVLGCQKNSDDAGGDLKFALSDQVFLGYKQCMSDNENQVTVCFDSVLTDSRCPEDVVCIWEGEAIARFTLNFKSGSPVILDLKPNTLDTLVNGYRFSFVELLPYPNSEVQNDLKDYEAVIELEKD